MVIPVILSVWAVTFKLNFDISLSPCYHRMDTSVCRWPLITSPIDKANKYIQTKDTRLCIYSQLFRLKGLAKQHTPSFLFFPARNMRQVGYFYTALDLSSGADEAPFIIHAACRWNRIIPAFEVTQCFTVSIVSREKSRPQQTIYWRLHPEFTFSP